jgi:hypothetical protein
MHDNVQYNLYKLLEMPIMVQKQDQEELQLKENKIIELINLLKTYSLIYISDGIGRILATIYKI